MISPNRNIAARYLDALPKSSPARSPLGERNKYNNGSPNKLDIESATKYNIGSPSRTRFEKHESPDLDDLARQMSIESPKSSKNKIDSLRSKFDSPSATVSSFKMFHNSRDSTQESGKNSVNSKILRSQIEPNLNIPLEPVSSSKSSLPADQTAYEYLCRIQAIKNWISALLGEAIPQTACQLITYVQNGIYLAKIANVFLPVKKEVFMNDSRLEFRHTENINRFFQLLEFLGIPDVFHFELTDLYDAKDVPKVWFCLHAISYKINKLNASYPAMENLVGKVQFDRNDIKIASRSLLGHHLPNFASADNEQASPGTSSYMNKALSVSPNKPAISFPGRFPSILPRRLPIASPSKLPTQPLESSYNFKTSPLTGKRTHTENPFLDKVPFLTHGSFQLKTLQMLDSSSEITDPFIGNISNSGSSLADKSSQFHTPELQAQLANIVKVQTLCKGSLLRYHMFVKKIMSRSYDTEFTEFFSVIRANLVRAKTIHRHKVNLLIYKANIVELQASARMKLSQAESKKVLIISEIESVLSLQCMIRGHIARRSIKMALTELGNNESQVLGLQCLLQSKPIRRRVMTVLNNKDSLESIIIQLQAIFRRYLYNKRKQENVISYLRPDSRIIELQSLIRGTEARNQVRCWFGGLFRQISSIIELQTVARGAVTRTRLCNNVLITLIGEDGNMNQLFAKARGNFVREYLAYKQALLKTIEAKQVVRLQSFFRGILLRFNNSVDMEDVYEHVDFIISLQSKIRTNSVRRGFVDMKRHYQNHKHLVIKAQAILRSSYTQNAYKAFTLMKNPPVDIVRKFAYLLSDSGSDFEEEIALNKLKDEILEQSRANEDLEAQIENLDIKLGLLDKNKISIEDFMKNNNKYKTFKPAAHGVSGKKTLEALNKSCKRRIELYSSMLYALQTNSTYWLRIYETMVPYDPKIPLKNLYLQVSSLFSLSRIAVNSKTREEYFFMKLVCALMKNDISRYAQSLADITKLKFAFWVPYLLELNNQVNQRAHLKKHFGKCIEKIIDDDEVTFESNPSIIHQLLRVQEVNIYGHSNKPKDLSPQDAIKREEVSSRFVNNLMSLRDATSEIMEALRNGVTNIPLHMRIAAKQAYELSRKRFPDNNEQSHLSVAGVIIIKHYIASLMHFPENFGYSTQDPIAENGTYPTRTANNLKYLSRVLLQVFSMKAFSDSFMKPLNDFVLSHVYSTKAIIKAIISVRDLEAEYEMNDYDDLVSPDRPQLTLMVGDMVGMEKLISRNLDIFVPGLDDQLYVIFSELNDVVSSADDYVTLTEMGNFTLTLSPTSQKMSMAESRIKNLSALAKRYLLYVIRVQEGNDLLELFVSGLSSDHESRFREIIESEMCESTSGPVYLKGIAGMNNTYSKSSLGDLSGMSYKTLKKKALQVIIQLEGFGVVTRKNSFQDLLNEVVSDIKTKDARRKSRKSQLLLANQTVTKLLEKEYFLKRQLNDYNKHIDKVLGNLQLRPKEKKLFNIIPVFSKQYFYHRQLKKNNRLPKFGSYKYSAKRLMEQDVVKNIGGSLYRRAASSSKIELMFSCHKSGVFVIEAATGTINIPGACNTIQLDTILDYQYQHKKEWVMFDGMVTFDTENLAALIFKNFYDIRKD